MLDRAALLSIIDSATTDEQLEALADAVQMAPEPTEFHADLEAVIASPSEVLTALRQAMETNRTNWKLAFAEGALVSRKPVDQREIDYRRGFFAGADYYLGRRVQIAKSRVARSALAGEEGE